MPIIGHIIALSFYILTTHLIAKSIGEKREIGYGKSVLWCLLFTPILGIIIVLLSDKKETSED